MRRDLIHVSLQFETATALVRFRLVKALILHNTLRCKAGALRDGDINLFVCSFIPLSVAWNAY